MPKNAEFVQIEPGEDANSVRDRLSFMRGKHVLLVWPEEGTALTRKLDLVLVQREAMRRAIRLALVTHDQQVIDHAHDLNISTFETIGQSERGRWKRGRTKVFANRYQMPKTETAPDELADVASRRGRRERTTPGFVRLLVIGVLLAVFGIFAVVVVPGATVTLALVEQTVSATVTVTVSTEATTVNVEERVIPGVFRRVQIQEVGERPTTGQETLPDTLATGTVIFINLTDQSVAIPSGTVVRGSTGEAVRFQTTLEGQLPGGVDERLELPVQALPDSSGVRGNLAAGQITTVEADWANAVQVVNTSPFSGGENRSLGVVTQIDRDRLRAGVRQQLQSRALVAMEPLSDDEVLFEESIRIVEERDDWTIYSANVGDYADTLRLTMEAVVEGVVVDMDLAENVAFAELSRLIPRGRSLIPGSLAYVIDSRTMSPDGTMAITITASGVVAGQLDTTALQQRLAGLTVDEARDLLTNAVDIQPDIEPQIIVSPDILNRMPLLPIRISIQLIDPS